jgi:hypothetical protein
VFELVLNVTRWTDILQTFSSPAEHDGGWISHVRGGSRILQLLGSSLQKTAIGQQLFARIRTICVRIL